MTTAFGVAAVTATLRDLLNDGIVRHNLSGLLGSTVTASATAPDRVVPEGNVEPTRLNLFLHRISANAGWRNEGLPSRDASGRHRLANVPLAIDLHYLLSAYGPGELHPEILLGHAMLWLQDRPVLTREAIRAALTPSVPPGSSLERALEDCGLADQIELVKLTPEYLDAEEMSKLWTATQSHLRTSAAYRATVILLESAEPVRSPLPVLSRGTVDPVSGRDRGVVVESSLEPPLPTLESVAPVSSQPVVRLGESIDLGGHHLDGAARTVLLGNDRFGTEQSLAALAGSSAGLVQFQIPVARADDFPVGVYRVAVRLVRPAEATPRTSNRLAMTVAPEITGLPMNVARNGAGTASFTLNFTPALRAGQAVSLVLGQQEYAPEAFATPTTTSLDFVIENAPVAPPPGHLARLRIDGIDSPIIDRAATRPVFLNTRIVIT